MKPGFVCFGRGTLSRVDSVSGDVREDVVAVGLELEIKRDEDGHESDRMETGGPDFALLLMLSAGLWVVMRPQEVGI